MMSTKKISAGNSGTKPKKTPEASAKDSKPKQPQQALLQFPLDEDLQAELPHPMKEIIQFFISWRFRFENIKHLAKQIGDPQKKKKLLSLRNSWLDTNARRILTLMEQVIMILPESLQIANFDMQEIFDFEKKADGDGIEEIWEEITSMDMELNKLMKMTRSLIKKNPLTT
jgi:hypothetical protein